MHPSASKLVWRTRKKKTTMTKQDENYDKEDDNKDRIRRQKTKATTKRKTKGDNDKEGNVED